MVAISEVETPKWFNTETGEINYTEYKEPSGSGWISGSSLRAKEALKTGVITRGETYIITTQEAERRSGKTLQELGARGLAAAVGGRITERGITLSRTVEVPFTPSIYKQVDVPGSLKVTGYVTGPKRVGETEKHYEERVGALALEEIEKKLGKETYTPTELKELRQLVIKTPEDTKFVSEGKELTRKQFQESLFEEKHRLEMLEKAPVISKKIEGPPRDILLKRKFEGGDLKFIRVNEGSPNEAIVRIEAKELPLSEAKIVYEISRDKITVRTYEAGKLVKTDTETPDKGYFYNVPVMVSGARQEGATTSYRDGETKAVITYPIMGIYKTMLSKDFLGMKDRKLIERKYEKSKLPTKILYHYGAFSSRESKDYIIATFGKEERKEVVLKTLSRVREKPFSLKAAAIEPVRSTAFQIVALLPAGGAALSVASRTALGAKVLLSKPVTGIFAAGIGYEAYKVRKEVIAEKEAGDPGAAAARAAIFLAQIGSGVAGWKVGAKSVKTQMDLIALRSRGEHEKINILNEQARIKASYEAIMETQTKFPFRKPTYKIEKVPIEVGAAGKIKKDFKEFDLDVVTRSGQEYISFAKLKGKTTVQEINSQLARLRTETMGKATLRMEELAGTAKARTDIILRKGKIVERPELTKKREIVKKERIEYGPKELESRLSDITFKLKRITGEIEPPGKAAIKKVESQFDYMNKRMSDLGEKALSLGRYRERVTIRGKRVVRVGALRAKTIIRPAEYTRIEKIQQKIRKKTPLTEKDKKFIREQKLIQKKRAEKWEQMKKEVLTPREIQKAELRVSEKMLKEMKIKERVVSPTKNVQLAHKKVMESPKAALRKIEQDIQKIGLKKAVKVVAKKEAKVITRVREPSIDTGNWARLSASTALMSVEQARQLTQQTQDQALRISRGIRQLREPRIKERVEEREKVRVIPSYSQIMDQIQEQAQREKQRATTITKQRMERETPPVTTLERPPPPPPEIGRPGRIVFPFTAFGYMSGVSQQIKTHIKTIRHEMKEMFK